MNEQDQHALTREQKVGFTLLLVFGVLTVGMGFLQMRNNLYAPFVSRAASLPQDDVTQLFSDEQIRLQAIDTDQDGINNYEELYFYKTSPYLPDTDSDGIKDKTEIDSGSDPLCPEGEQCVGSDDAGVSTSTSGIFSIDPADAPQAPNLPILGEGNPAAQVGTQQQLESIVNDADAIRELLAQTGQFSMEQLEEISDEDLLALVRDITESEDEITQ